MNTDNVTSDIPREFYNLNLRGDATPQQVFEVVEAAYHCGHSWGRVNFLLSKINVWISLETFHKLRNSVHESI